MPANPRSLQVTEAYRTRLFAIRDRLERWVTAQWPTIENLDATRWPERTAIVLAQAQTEGIRASGGYVAVFLRTELGRRVASPVPDAGELAGRSRDGRPLAESLKSPLIGVYGALKDGRPPDDALRYGLIRAKRMVGVDFDHAHREALRQLMEASEFIEGYQRAVRGTCGACVGDIAVQVRTELPSIPLLVHPNCQCVTEPVVVGVPNAVPRLSGTQIFEGKSRAEQDEMLGPDAAAKVLAGEITLADLVGSSRLDSDQQDFITQATP